MILMKPQPRRLLPYTWLIAGYLLASALAAPGAGAFLGVQVQKTDNGLLVVAAVEGSPAAKAGLKARDVLTHVGGERVTEPAEFAAEMGKASPGDKVKFKLQREGEEKELEVELGERPAPPERTGLLNVKAPEIDIEQWHNLPEGKKQIKLADYKGKTVFLYCFQSW